MNHIRTIFKREYMANFRTPIGFVLFAIFMTVGGLYFASALLADAIDIVGELSFLQSFMFIFIPLITMRTFAENRKNGTEEFLVTSPASSLEIILAKYLAAFAWFLTLTAGTLIHVLITILYGGLLDTNVLGAYIGFIFLGATYLAIGMFVSAFTRKQMIAAFLTFISIVLLTLIDFLSAFIQVNTTSFLSTVNLFGFSDERIRTISRSIAAALIWLNPKSRFDNIFMGIFEAAPLVFSISLIAVFLFLTNRVIEKRRRCKKETA